MSSTIDLKSTLNLPRTTFPMKASLPSTEPPRIESWGERDLYGKLRAARKGAPRFLLHDGPPYANGHTHLGTALNKVLKDIVVRSHNMAGYDAPYRPGWDCHGLPIKLQVDRKLGSKKREMSPLAFRQACREHAEKYIEIQRAEFKRLGVMGEWDTPYLTMSPDYQATIVRQLAETAEKGLVYKAKKSVHWCISCRTALAEAEVEYDESHQSPTIDVRFPLSEPGAAALTAKHPALRGKRISAVIWTTTPWTMPGNLALAFHPEADYGFYPVAGDPEDVLLLARELSGSLGERYGIAFGAPLAEVKGAALEGIEFDHPWIDRPAPGVLADYVTLDTGTGIVHTAPGHGWDDYLTGIRYGLDIYCPVDEAGRFTDEVSEFQGRKVFEANPAVIELLRERGRLLHSSKQVHSYPVCWRCKNPIIFRATAQWFIGLDRQELRQRALDAIATVRWHPAWGQERITGMIANRPDWCISRQRLWGVPIPAFYCASCEEPLLTAELARRVADMFQSESADAWYERSARELLPEGFTCPGCGHGEFEKETDILDVWFDSGSSWAAVLGGPADVYLEGSDQHRGWFHSSLLISVANQGCPPYRDVVTHGFTVDGDGRKMSKSLGNVIAPQKVVDRFGAEILRLWVTMVDYREDMPISEEMFPRLGEAYRKIRNTCRYLLSNLTDFDPAVDSVPEERLERIDRYALAAHRRLVARVRKAYEEFEYHVVYHQLVQYCAVDLSALYLDVLKDRLYCDPRSGARRRSAQTVLHRIALDVTRLMAPVLPFTADEVWALLPGVAEESVHLSLFPEAESPAPAELEEWEALREIRATVMKALEEARARKEISSSLGAQLQLRAPARQRAALAAYEEHGDTWPGELANLFIVSRVALEEGDGDLEVSVAQAPGAKCERCWTVSEEVGRQPVHPGVCPRCASVLEAM